jgi:hypothetical protein
MKRTTKIINAVIHFLYVFTLTYVADSCGYNRAKEEQQAQINLDKKTLKNHAKEINTIHTESDSSANNRLRKNLRSN